MGKPLRKDGLIEANRLVQEEELMVIQCIDELGTERLGPIFDALEERVPYEQLHLWRLIYQVTSGEETTAK